MSCPVTIVAPFSNGSPLQTLTSEIVMIRSGKSNEADVLTEISFASKGYWHYPEEYFKAWHNELTISSEYIEENDVLVFEKRDAIIGYYSIVELKENIEISGIKIDKGFWLEHMFIEPQHIGHGIGTLLFRHLRERCVARSITELKILADPNARGFYEKMGCIFMGEYPSTIKNRTTLLLHLQL